MKLYLTFAGVDALNAAQSGMDSGTLLGEQLGYALWAWWLNQQV